MINNVGSVDRQNVNNIVTLNTFSNSFYLNWDRFILSIIMQISPYKYVYVCHRFNFNQLLLFVVFRYNK